MAAIRSPFNSISCNLSTDFTETEYVSEEVSGVCGKPFWVSKPVSAGTVKFASSLLLDADGTKILRTSSSTFGLFNFPHNNYKNVLKTLPFFEFTYKLI